MIALNKYKIIMTGGGTGGHVIPNLALIPKLKEKGYEVEYIGTEDGIEKKLVTEKKIKYHSISSGKLRRYFDIKNFTDPFRVIKGVFEAKRIIKSEKPDIVFSKGGFVAVPVVLAAYLHKVPVVAHESDITPGLANRLSLPYCSKICVTFPEALEHIKKQKGVLTGTPIRPELLSGSKLTGLKLCGFDGKRPVIFIMGGSTGSKVINETIRKALEIILKKYDVIHMCGRGNIENSFKEKQGYVQFEYIGEELPHIMAAADIILSRAGANSIFEILALKKPNLLIPLSKNSSRGDQILNAASFEKSGFSVVLQEDELSTETLISKLEELYLNKNKFIKNMGKSSISNGVERVIEVILENTRPGK
jgi:UDP-N-acetylglucosamine--N-acetylmuramyl-(pentapeptide) pyrophosphoryl-undecaprenol N-acetylglucosamine transferase